MLELQNDAMVPYFLKVTRRIEEIDNIVSLEISVPDSLVGQLAFKPGQFNMLYTFGVGEIPISISGNPAVTHSVTHTVRAVGPVSRALTEMQPNDELGVRGPYGNSWPVDLAEHKDLLIIAGGIGLMPLRPVIYHVLNNRSRYNNVSLLYGARDIDSLLYQHEFGDWQSQSRINVLMTLNEGDRRWKGDVGYVTRLLSKADFNAANTIALICGPDVMIRSTARAVTDFGVPQTSVFSSLERNMKCALGTCGHCQFGPYFLCKDGPIFSYDQVGKLMSHKEL